MPNAQSDDTSGGDDGGASVGDPFAEQYAVRTRELLEELADVESRIRLFDPTATTLDEQSLPAPSVVDLIHDHYRILRTLRQRQALLRRSLQWIVDRPQSSKASAPLVQRVHPPLRVQVDDDGVWRDAQLEGIDVSRGDGAYVRLVVDAPAAAHLGPLIRVDAEDVKLPP